MMLPSFNHPQNGGDHCASTNHFLAVTSKIFNCNDLTVIGQFARLLSKNRYYLNATLASAEIYWGTPVVISIFFIQIKAQNIQMTCNGVQTMQAIQYGHIKRLDNNRKKETNSSKGWRVSKGKFLDKTYEERNPFEKTIRRKRHN